jgi:phosphoribosylamine--glycine ligase
VVLASRGYPGHPEIGDEIEGLEPAAADALVFHAGTAERDGRIVTAGGRVLTVVGLGPNVEEARARAYQAAERVRFAGMHFRRDIGARIPGAALASGQSARE